MIRWATLIAALLATSSAEAQCLGFQCPPGVLGAAASGTSPPLNSFTTPSGAYSFRKLLSAYAGSAVKLRRVDATTADIGFVGNDFDTAAATAFCTTACTVQTWFDQSGNGRDLVQLAAANQPAYLAGCIGALPCAQWTVNTQALGGPSVTPASGTVSLSAVGRRSGGSTGVCTLFRENGSAGNRLTIGTTAASVILTGGTSGSITAAASDGGWHVATGVIAGASSVLNIDGTETTGTVTGNTAAGTAGITTTIVAPVVCSQTEAVFWDNYAMPAGERAALAANQRDYWMPLPLDTFTAPSGAYSFRKLKSTYTGPAIRIRRASDNAELDINFLGFTSFTGAPIDTAAAVAHCAATSCFVRTWYNQDSGGATYDLIQTTPASQPLFVFNCKDTLPCLRYNSVAMILATAGNITPATGVVSMSVVAVRNSGTALTVPVRQNGTLNRIRFGGAGVISSQGGASGGVAGVAAEAAWHAVVATLTGDATSVMNVDGTETTGTATGNTTPGVQGLAGTAAVVDQTELIVWDNTVLPPASRSALIANQKSFYGIP